ncbi:putative transposase [Trichonephila clavipes]|nr:putative transposase [Trichonephila clavipes]
MILGYFVLRTLTFQAAENFKTTATAGSDVVQSGRPIFDDFNKRILFSDEAHFWLNGYVNKQNCRIWSEANPQVYVETPLHPEKLTVWCALWAGGILLQKR